MCWPCCIPLRGAVVQRPASSGLTSRLPQVYAALHLLWRSFGPRAAPRAHVHAASALRAEARRALLLRLATMCGRFNLRNPKDIIERFGFMDWSDKRIEPRFNIAPSQEILTI